MWKQLSAELRDNYDISYLLGKRADGAFKTTLRTFTHFLDPNYKPPLQADV